MTTSALTTRSDARPTSVRRPTAIDLFAGAGGLSLGFEQAGFDVVAAVEYDPVHAATHLYNFPHCEVVCRDLAKVSAEALLEAARSGVRNRDPEGVWDGTVDAVIGGPPCQGFSTGGKREIGDLRNQMVLEFVRVVEQLRPRVLCLENVAGILDDRFAAVRGEAFGRLRAAGYVLSGTERALNAKDFGVPQSRQRVIVLGWLDGDPGQPSAPDAPTVSVADAFEGLPNPAHYPALLVGDQSELRPADVAVRKATTGVYALTLAGLRVPSWDFSYPRTWDDRLLTGSRRTVHSPDTISRFGKTLPGAVEAKSRLFRLAPRGQARTLRAGTGTERGAHTSPRPIHPSLDRVITVREAARLHGYPDWFRFHVTNWHGHRQVGNSVPPPLARAAGEQLIGKLSISPSRPTDEVGLGDVSLLELSRSEAASLLGAVADELPAPRRRSESKKQLTATAIV